MTEINEFDNYIQRLGKIIPSYIPALITLLIPLYDGLKTINPELMPVAAIVIIAGIAICYIALDIIKEHVRKLSQITLTVIGIVIYFLTVTWSYFTWVPGASNILLIIATIYTFIVPEFVKGGIKYYKYIAYDPANPPLKQHEVLADPSLVTVEEKTYIIYFEADILSKYQNSPNYTYAVNNTIATITNIGAPPWSISVNNIGGTYCSLTVGELVKLPSNEQSLWYYRYVS